MTNRLLSFILCLLFLSTGPAAAQQMDAQTTPAITLGIQTSVYSNMLGEERPILIYTPEGYAHGTGKYPVIYLLDGDSHLLHTAGTTQFLSRNGKMPEVIIVGIPNTERTRDLKPALSTPNDRFPTAGGADTFLSFIEEELVPFVESNYRTADYRILIGHSFGGLFSVNALLQKPDLFNAHISISPSLWWDNKGLLPKAEAFFEKNRGLRRFYYMTMGNEGGGMLAGAWGFAGIMEEKGGPFFKWHFELMENETHGSVPHRSTYDGLEMLYDGWAISNFREAVAEKGLAAVEDHAKSLSTRYGYEVEVPESVVNIVGYELLAQNQIEDAIKVFERNIKNFPTSPNVYDSAGDGYKANGAMKQAAESYAKACSLGTETDHPNKGVYCANAEALKGELE
ncbi:MAG: alpha/beta hydrolase-fold protein [Bacteroidota bacterium]